MASLSSNTHSTPVSMFEPSPGAQLPPAVLRAVFDSLDKPLVVKNQLQPWTNSQSWTAVNICNTLGNKGETTTFKVYPRRDSETWKRSFNSTAVVFETQCTFVNAKFTDFVEWLSYAPSSNEPPAEGRVESAASSFGDVNPLLSYPSSDYWVYADYKYMCQVSKDYPDLLAHVDWGVFGFDGCDGKDSTIWIGSTGAYTPCHYDTYGCNIVAQLSGEKKWTMFNPRDSDMMYPTRVPYEESSVFSSVNIPNPDLSKHPSFTRATPFVAVLQTGDVLYVPKHWWHYVESVSKEPTVSINMWIEQDSFPYERVKEAITRTLVSQFSVDIPREQASAPEWINPNETLFSTDVNLKLVSRMIQDLNVRCGKRIANNKEVSSRESECDIKESDSKALSVQDFVRVLTNDKVVTMIASVLLEEHVSAQM